MTTISMRLSGFIGHHIALRKQGREFKGRSPTDGTERFFVSDEKGRWFDFATGKNGDAVDFLVAYQGRSPAEALAIVKSALALDGVPFGK